MHHDIGCARCQSQSVTSQEGALAAVALCAANGPQLAGMVADGLCRAAATANSSMTRKSGASMTSEGVESTAVHQMRGDVEDRPCITMLV